MDEIQNNDSQEIINSLNQKVKKEIQILKASQYKNKEKLTKNSIKISL